MMTALQEILVQIKVEAQTMITMEVVTQEVQITEQAEAVLQAEAQTAEQVEALLQVEAQITEQVEAAQEAAVQVHQTQLNQQLLVYQLIKMMGKNNNYGGTFA